MSGSRPIQVLIVDDHPAVREGLATRISLQKDMQVCGEAVDIGSAVKLIGETKPDVAVVDVSLRSGNGLDLIKHAKDNFPELKILVYSMHPEALYASRALRAGALGYVTKDRETEYIMNAIRKVSEGKVCLSEMMTDKLLRQNVGGAAIDRATLIEILSDRELEAFRFVGEGLDVREISEKMFVSPKTVETYCARIREKLGIKTGRQLIQTAAQWVAGQT